MTRKKDTENGVSPVVGVMLMLVVTIIIAAVVSAFAGGLGTGTSKAPEMSIQGTFSQSSGLTMTHTGGDSLVTKDLQILVRKSEEFGHGESAINVIIVNTSTISDINGKYWVNSDGTYGVMSWRPGESMYVIKSDLQNSNITFGGYSSGTDPGSSIANPANIGKTFTLEVGYKNGKMIASTPIKIQP